MALSSTAEQHVEYGKLLSEAAKRESLRWSLIAEAEECLKRLRSELSERIEKLRIRRDSEVRAQH